MTLERRKIIDRTYKHGYQYKSAFTSAGGTNEVITTTIAAMAAADTNNYLHLGVPVQVATTTFGAQPYPSDALTLGYLTGIGFPVQVFDNVTGKEIDDGAGNVVYGNLTFPGSVWTLSYFSNIAGTVTPYTMPVSKVINFAVQYQYDDIHFPIPNNIIDGTNFGGGSASERLFSDVLTVTATNVLSALTMTPIVPNDLLLTAAGFPDATVAAGLITVTGSTVTWNNTASSGGFDLNVGDYVVAKYLIQV